MVFVLAMANTLLAQTKQLKTAYSAFAEYDYFKARKIFYQVTAKKNNAAANYGLALIALRTDNPFNNLDTATKYSNLAFQAYLKQAVPFNFLKYQVDSTSIRKLIDSVAYKVLGVVKTNKSVAACDAFLSAHYLCKKKYILEALYLRDELEFNRVMAAYKSDSTKAFIATHPQSLFLKEAYVLLDRQIYDESTGAESEAQYLAFVRKYPKNTMVNTAYEHLFAIYSKNKDVKGLGNFVSEFPKAPQYMEAWKLLFSLSVRGYTFSDLKKFVDEYPEFPLKNSILKELELNKLQLYPLQIGDFVGYIDDVGRIKIAPQYDEGSEFFEGLAVVSRNDSLFYINKENQNPFAKVYSAAYSFHYGIAAVKENGKWFFINRPGQIISDGYDELQEMSGAAYVYKQGDVWGALDQYGQVLIAPQFEKLGDFKNGFAYYMDKGLYGFVSREGAVRKAEYEWISDFNEEQLAVVRKDGRYGIINSAGSQVLNCEYDQIIRSRGRVYIVVSTTNYGFYSFDGCFLQQPQFEFLREKPAEYYSDGSYFRGVRKNEQVLLDANGKAVFAANQYEDFGFFAEGLMRVKLKGKWGYVDRRFSPHISIKYTEASDFEGGVALVRSKDANQLINIEGESIYETKNELSRINAKWFIEEREEGKMLLDRKGNVLAHNIEEVAPLGHFGWILRLSGGEIKLIND